MFFYRTHRTLACLTVYLILLYAATSSLWKNGDYFVGSIMLLGTTLL